MGFSAEFRPRASCRRESRVTPSTFPHCRRFIDLPNGAESFAKVFWFLQAQAHTEWLLKTTDVTVFRTKEAARAVDLTGALPLVSGNYLIIPRFQLAQMGASDWKGLELRREFLVPKNTALKDVFEVAREVHPTVTCVSMNVGVKKA